MKPSEIPSECEQRLFNTELVSYGIRFEPQMPHAYVETNNK